MRAWTCARQRGWGPHGAGGAASGWGRAAAGFLGSEGGALLHQRLGHVEIVVPRKAHTTARSKTKVSWARGVWASHQAASKAARHACACSTGHLLDGASPGYGRTA